MRGLDTSDFVLITVGIVAMMMAWGEMGSSLRAIQADLRAIRAHVEGRAP